ncbi:hypothetical protein [Campylobacter hepaticus]|uniref:hypothetical protein n=1 Tax=Campylobacter hepaticus TaxID=1813019 RepID=UPI0021AA2419|nr:hypothetical protein [Campylobacter hepaticus]
MIFLHRQNNISYKADIFGVEIDLRRNNKGLILNHDLLQFDVKYPLLTKKLHLFKDVPIIFNIKESNLEELIIDMFDKMDNGGGV